MLTPTPKTDLSAEFKNPVSDLAKLNTRTVYTSKSRAHKRNLLSLRNKETAAMAIEGLDKEVEIFGFTKGQFSMIELIAAVLDITGPAELTISTWTAAKYDIGKILEFLETGQVTGSRWLVDLTFQRRAPELAHRIRQTFGEDAIRIAQTHAEFSLIQNEEWRIVIRTSMNLNTNPRFEDFTLAHDPPLADFLEEIITEIWNRQPRKLAHGTTTEQQQFFRECM